MQRKTEMATKIIQAAPKWNPVSINMTFDTPEQLKVFVAIMGSEGSIGSVLAQENDYNREDTIAAIRSMIDYDTWKQLHSMVR